MLEFLSHEKLFFFLEQKGVVLNKTDEKTEEGNSEMVMELDLSVLTDEQMEELRQFAAAEKLQMEREAAEAETAPATVAQVRGDARLGCRATSLSHCSRSGTDG